MPLAELHLADTSIPLPERIAAFLKAADRSCDEFFDTGTHKQIPRFLPANYALVYHALKEVQDRHPILGNRFCEWGSGLGTATCLASLMGFEAYGIEIEAELVNRARSLARKHAPEATFMECSFLPEGFDFLHAHGGRELLKPRRSRNAGCSYEDANWELEDVDLFYVYPWPEEQESTLELFESVAADGAYLICYYGDDELCVYRKE